MGSGAAKVWHGVRRLQSSSAAPLAAATNVRASFTSAGVADAQRPGTSATNHDDVILRMAGPVIAVVR